MQVKLDGRFYQLTLTEEKCLQQCSMFVVETVSDKLIQTFAITFRTCRRRCRRVFTAPVNTKPTVYQQPRQTRVPSVVRLNNKAHSRKPATSQLRDITCHVGSHSVICHPTQVNAPHLTPVRKAGTRFTYPGGMEG